MELNFELMAHLSLCIPPDTLTSFAREDLDLSDLQITNAMQTTTTIQAEIHVKGITMWIDKHETGTVGALQGLLKKAADKGVFDHEITKILLDKQNLSLEDKLRAKDVSVIARHMKAPQWKQFAHGYLKIDLNKVEAMMPVVNDNYRTDVINLLNTWRNIHFNCATIDKIKTIIQESEVLSKGSRDKCRKAIDEFVNGQMVNSEMDWTPSTEEDTINFNNLRDALDIQTIEGIFEDQALSPGEIEMVQKYFKEDSEVGTNSTATFVANIICSDLIKSMKIRKSLERQGKLDLVQFLG